MISNLHIWRALWLRGYLSRIFGNRPRPRRLMTDRRWVRAEVRPKLSPWNRRAECPRRTCRRMLGRVEAELVRDRTLLELAKTEAAKVVHETDPQITVDDRHRVMSHLRQHWQRRYGLVEVG